MIGSTDRLTYMQPTNDQAPARSTFICNQMVAGLTDNIASVSEENDVIRTPPDDVCTAANDADA